MRIEDMTGYVFYASKDRSRVEAVMDGDNDSHGDAWSRGMERVDEVDYWLVKLKQEREENERKRIADAIRHARNDGWAVVC